MAGYADLAEFGDNSSMDWNILAVAPIDEVIRPLRVFQRRLFFFTTGLFLVTMALMMLMARGIVGSVKRLLDGARRVTGGDLMYRVDPGPADEFGALAMGVNETLDQLVEAREVAEGAPGQVRVSGHDEPRTPYTHEWGDRHGRTSAGF